MTGRRLVRSDIVRIAVLASGSGTLLEAILADGIPVELVVVDRPSRATEVAEQHGVAAVHVERTTFGEGFDRTGYTKPVVEVLEEHTIDLIVMAGFGTARMSVAYGKRVSVRRDLGVRRIVKQKNTTKKNRN